MKLSGRGMEMAQQKAEMMGPMHVYLGRFCDPGVLRKGHNTTKWIQGAIRRPGAFTAKAKRAGKGVQAFAAQVLKPGSRASTRTKRQAALARTLAKISRSR